MNLLLVRKNRYSTGTGGELLIDGAFQAFTQERPLDSVQGSVGPYAVPNGTYPIRLEYSLHFDMITPHLVNVPGRSYIEIHPGNYPTQIEGCIEVGLTQDKDYVGQSRVAFQALMRKLSGETGLSITIREA